jgi:hypothetical protein
MILFSSGRENSKGYKHCCRGQRSFAVQYRTVHFLSSICSESDRLERGSHCRMLKLRQMGTQGVHKKGILPWLVRGLVMSVQEILSCLGCSTQPSIKIFSSPPCSISLYWSIVQQAGQAVLLHQLSLNMCLCSECMQCGQWSSCRGFCVHRLRQGYVGVPQHPL